MSLIMSVYSDLILQTNNVLSKVRYKLRFSATAVVDSLDGSMFQDLHQSFPGLIVKEIKKYLHSVYG